MFSCDGLRKRIGLVGFAGGALRSPGDGDVRPLIAPFLVSGASAIGSSNLSDVGSEMPRESGGGAELVEAMDTASSSSDRSINFPMGGFILWASGAAAPSVFEGAGPGASPRHQHHWR